MAGRSRALEYGGARRATATRFESPYRAPRGKIIAGVLARGLGDLDHLGFEFGLPKVLRGSRPGVLGIR